MKYIYLAFSVAVLFGCTNNSSEMGESILSESALSSKATNRGSCVGNFMWIDSDADGIQDSAEKGLAGNPISLFNLAGDEVDSVTSLNGFFSLCADPGEYILKAAVPDGMEITQASQGNRNTKDSDANEFGEIRVTLLSGRKPTKYDIGFVETGSGGGVDQPSEPGVPTDPPAPNQPSGSGCVGNRVWLDANGDGFQDIGEKSFAGAEVILLSSDGNEVQRVTSINGSFKLCSYPGPHSIKVVIPSGLEVSPADQGTSDQNDSDANSEGLIELTVDRGKNRTKYDIGLTSIDSGNGEPTEGPVEVDPVDQVPPPPSAGGQVKWGFWVEARNAYNDPGRTPHVDEGVETTFENYSFAHVKAYSKNRVNGNIQDKTYVVNMIEAAERTNTKLDLQLGGAGEYGWNFTTGRGNFNVKKWFDSISAFKQQNTISFYDTSKMVQGDPVAYEAIRRAIANGTIRYVFLIDEPNHKRWSPSWDGGQVGDPNWVTNQILDDMAEYVKSIWGAGVKSIVRTSALNLVQESRGGLFEFHHMTHAYLTISSTKWCSQNERNKGPNRGLEFFLNIKNNNPYKVTNLSAYPATNLRPSLMVQAGFESKCDPWTAKKDFASRWWSDDIRYPYSGATTYVKAAPNEMDFWIKSMLAPRDPQTGVLNAGGARLIDDFVIFRADRLPTDSGRLPFSTYPHYRDFLDTLRADIASGNNTPTVGIPVGWQGS